MARNIHSRLSVTGHLTTQTGLHVGGLGDSADTDLPLAQNGRGEYYIPGTSICGALRAWCEENFREPLNQSKVLELVPQLFGPRHSRGAADGHASFIIVDDVVLPEDLEVEIRDGVGIDRRYGAAADHAKFDRAIVPCGTMLCFDLTVELPSAEPPGARHLVASIVAALDAGEIRLGGAKTRGLGNVKALTPLKIKEQTLGTRDGMLKTLLGAQDPAAVPAGNLARNGAGHLSITIGWRPCGPLMVKAGYDGMGVDSLPLTSGVGEGQVSLVLPGSSIKGALRSQAERIIRTLLPHNYPSKNDFHDQIKIDLVDELFGTKKEKEPAQGKNETAAAFQKRTARGRSLGRGALSIDDCYAKSTDSGGGLQHYLSSKWSEVVTGRVRMPVGDHEEDVTYTEQELWRALKALDNDQEAKRPVNKFQIQHHVAIDRWTGGASEGALFSVLAPTGTDWEEMRLGLDLSRLVARRREVRKETGKPDREEWVPDNDNTRVLRKHAVMLLLLILRDLTENRIPLGFGVNRGMGEVRIDSIEGLKQLPGLLEIADTEFSAKVENGRLVVSGGVDGLKGKLTKCWAEFLNAKENESNG